ncbi:MAG: BolA family protein [Robiginitomaculum sp.]
MGIIGATIKEKLTNNFSPSHLEVIDESHKHAGHGGVAVHAAEHGDGGESHFFVKISASAFNDMGRLARQRAVYAALGDLMEGRVHALRLEVKGT